MIILYWVKKIMRILLAEPDPGFSNRITSLFEKSGYTVDKAFSGDDLLAFAAFDIYDVMIVDSLLPENGGISAIKRIRKNKNSTPIMYFTKTREIEERVTALDSGADDCMTKPFAIAEFSARIRALSRRKPMQLQYGIMSFSDITLDLNTNELICNEHIVHLGVKEFQIMKILIASGKNVVLKDSLADKVWGINSATEYNNTEVYISFLRKKLKKLNSQVQINTIRGLGYILSSK